MSATSALESNEDLENIPLVRMADVQPDRSSDMYLGGTKKLETSNVIEDYNVCNVEENANIGSMVSIKLEDVIVVEDGTEITIPDTKEPVTVVLDKPVKQNPDSWPSLEILPGGVIKHAYKYDDNTISTLCESGEAENDDDKMYVCAKCQQRFKFLLCLVEHVKWHKDQKKREKLMRYIGEVPERTKVKISIAPKNKYSNENSKKKKVMSKLKSKCKTVVLDKPVKQNPDSWPSLEILPGGVIKHAYKYDDNTISTLCESGEAENDDDKMYVCAKCQQRFKFLLCLVEHVKWHKDQKKREKLMRYIGEVPERTKVKISIAPKNKYSNVNSNKKKVMSKLKSKCKVP